ncbi:hypothetical protein C8F04DRAFT_1191039 [Mycena alexandri]|uniref:Uncharacterized protein n=1 Tax=Mycena alexandri TaxID=1745969 RepID=A0AAD6SE00_9AGAR|nr:hypothetical protein C8F04DRAFT_1191039 [Mycena alexandri]
MNPNLLSALQGLIPLLVAGGQASGNTGQAALPPLPVGAYTSARPQSRPQAIPSSLSGHPNPNTSLPTPNVLQPILGLSSLGVSMSANSNQPRRRQASGSVAALSRSQISQANNGRLTAIENHFPSTQSLTRRTRTRGRAQPTPSLTPAPTSVESIVDVDSDSGQRFLNIDVHVTLRSSPQPDDIVFITLNNLTAGVFITLNNREELSYYRCNEYEMTQAQGTVAYRNRGVGRRVLRGPINWIKRAILRPQKSNRTKVFVETVGDVLSICNPRTTAAATTTVSPSAAVRGKFVKVFDIGSQKTTGSGEGVAGKWGGIEDAAAERFSGRGNGRASDAVMDGVVDGAERKGKPDRLLTQLAVGVRAIPMV